MAFVNDYLLKVDIKRRLANIVPTFAQGETLRLRFKIYDNNVLYDLTDFTRAEIIHKLPSGDSFSSDASLVNGEIVYDYPTKVELGEVGKVEVSLVIYSDKTSVSIHPFTIFVYDNFKGENLSYISVLQELIESTQYLEVQVQQALIDVNQAVSDVNDLKIGLNNLIDNVEDAEVIRQTNETNRQNNESTRESNELNRIANESLRDTTFNNKITEVNNKISDVNNLIDDVEDAEDIRDNNETIRITNEALRQTDFNNKISDMNNKIQDVDDKLDEVDTVITQIQTDTQSAINDVQNFVDNLESVGVFTLSTAYKKNNVVLNNGSSWIALQDTQNNPLPVLPIEENTWWRLVAQRGTNGTGSTSTVNNISPDVNGNVTLTANDVNAYSKSEIEDKIETKTGDLTALKTNNKSNIVEAINELQEKKANSGIYGVKINTLDSNPETSVTYTDNAIGFTPARGNNGSFTYGSWQNVFPFNQIKPCVVKNGVVNYYLNPNDYTKKADGTNADVTTGNDGDVMVEFPKIWWKLETIGNDLYVRYATKQVDSSWKCHAHTRGTTEKDFIYISAYMGYETGGKLRSLSGKTPTVNKTIGAFRTIAQANGSGYEQMAYYQLLMLQVLFIVMFKSRDSQTALGRGYVDGNSASTTTGGANAKGMFYGETTGKQQNKFCGIEDFWGNTYYWIDGIVTDSSYKILIGNNNFNDTGSGYTVYNSGISANTGGYIDQVQGGTETGFVIKSKNGTETTYYCDFGNLDSARVAYFGAGWASASFGGCFHLRLYRAASDADSNVGSRLLCYL